MSEGKSRVFISWSGDLAKAVGHELEKFFPTVIQSLEPWMSDTDITQGGFWHQEIMRGLDGAKVGVVVLTSANVTKPWLHYEVGYLTRYINNGEGLVSPILVDVSTSQIQGPMTSLQATAFDREPMLKLVKDINKAIGQPTGEPVIESIFGYVWDGLRASVDEAVNANRPTVSLKKAFDQERVLTEILTSVRQLAARSIDPDLVLDLLARLEAERMADAASKEAQVRRELYRRNLGEAEARRILEQFGSLPLDDVANRDTSLAIDLILENAYLRTETDRGEEKSRNVRLGTLAKDLSARLGISVVGVRRSHGGDVDEVLVEYGTKDQDVHRFRDMLSRAAGTDVAVRKLTRSLRSESQEGKAKKDPD